MGRLLGLWEKEYLALSRDVLGLAVLFLMPAAFIVVMSLALSDVFKGGAGRGTEFAVIATDGKFAKQLSERLAADGFRPTSEPDKRGVVHAPKPSLTLIVPPGFEHLLALRRRAARGHARAPGEPAGPVFDAAPGQGGTLFRGESRAGGADAARRPDARALVRRRDARFPRALGPARDGDRVHEFRRDRLGAPRRGVLAHARAGDRDRRRRQHTRRGRGRHHGAAFRDARSHAEALRGFAHGLGPGRFPRGDPARGRRSGHPPA